MADVLIVSIVIGHANGRYVVAVLFLQTYLDVNEFIVMLICLLGGGGGGGGWPLYTVVVYSLVCFK